MHIEGKNYKMRFSNESNDLFRKVCLEGRLSQMFQILPCSCLVFPSFGPIAELVTLQKHQNTCEKFRHVWCGKNQTWKPLERVQQNDGA